MGFREKLEDRIRRKQQEIRDYESRLAEARAYVDGLQEALRLLPRNTGTGDGIGDETVLRTGSKIFKTMELLKHEGKPMHVADILRGLGVDPTKRERVSLSGSLGAYVRRHEIFDRPAPNVFGLIGMRLEEDSAGPPDDFGQDNGDTQDDFRDIDFGEDDIPFPVPKEPRRE